MKRLVVASGNKGKLREIGRILEESGIELLTPADFPGLPEVDETGATFEANAILKAQSAADFTGLPALADDSGLVVDILDGRPGVYSARFAGIGAGDAANNSRLLDEMAGVPAEKRQAAFHCVIALCLPGGTCKTFYGKLSGTVLDSPRGDDGFGYDPLFLVPEFGMTLSELPLDAKNSISHRGRALEEFRRYLREGASI